MCCLFQIAPQRRIDRRIQITWGSVRSHESAIPREFRKRHLGTFKELFLEVLKIAQNAGMVKLGHISLDGSKIRANASKHKAMSYDRMKQQEQQLRQEIAELTRQAERTDRSEDKKYGNAMGDELPEELARRETRLTKIQEAMAALEQDAKEKAEQEQQKDKKDDDNNGPTHQTGAKKRKRPRKDSHPKVFRLIFRAVTWSNQLEITPVSGL